VRRIEDHVPGLAGILLQIAKLIEVPDSLGADVLVALAPERMQGRRLREPPRLEDKALHRVACPID